MVVSYYSLDTIFQVMLPIHHNMAILKADTATPRTNTITDLSL